MSEFKGRVFVYNNINGREKKIDKEFDNEEEFQKFVNETPELKWTEDVGGWMNYPGIFGFERFLDDFVNRKLGRIGGESTKKELPGGDVVDLSQYESEYNRLEQEKQQKEQKKKDLEDTLKRLKDYKKKFKEEGKDDLVSNIDKDIEKVEKELKQFKE